MEYTSGDPALAAKVANQLADVYIGWQREAKIAQTKDATAWLKDQIEVLRKATASSEEAVEKFRSSEGLYAGSNNVALSAQQLIELNSQLILADAQKSEAEARARLIKKMLADRGDIDATPEVIKSPLIINLIEQRVEVQRQLATLSATLLPSHPRIQQLKSELADVRAQIRDEAGKVVGSLENEAHVAAAREASLRQSLNAAKTTSAGSSDSEIKLRALEREAKANRDLLGILSRPLSRRVRPPRHGRGAGASGHRLRRPRLRAPVLPQARAPLASRHGRDRAPQPRLRPRPRTHLRKPSRVRAIVAAIQRWMRSTSSHANRHARHGAWSNAASLAPMLCLRGDRIARGRSARDEAWRAYDPLAAA